MPVMSSQLLGVHGLQRYAVEYTCPTKQNAKRYLIVQLNLIIYSMTTSRKNIGNEVLLLIKLKSRDLVKMVTIKKVLLKR